MTNLLLFLSFLFLLLCVAKPIAALGLEHDAEKRYDERCGHRK